MANSFREADTMVYRDSVTFVTGFNVLADEPFTIGSPTSVNSFLNTYNQIRPYGGVSGMVTLTGDQSITGIKTFNSSIIVNASTALSNVVINGNLDGGTNNPFVISCDNPMKIGDVYGAGNGACLTLNGQIGTFIFDNNGYGNPIEVRIGNSSCPSSQLGFYDVANDNFNTILVGDNSLNISSDLNINGSLNAQDQLTFATNLWSTSTQLILATDNGIKRAEITWGKFGVNMPVGAIPQYTFDVSGTGNFGVLFVSGKDIKNLYYPLSNSSGFITSGSISGTGGFLPMFTGSGITNSPIQIVSSGTLFPNQLLLQSGNITCVKPSGGGTYKSFDLFADNGNMSWPNINDTYFQLSNRVNGTKHELLNIHSIDATSNVMDFQGYIRPVAFQNQTSLAPIQFQYCGLQINTSGNDFDTLTTDRAITFTMTQADSASFLGTKFKTTKTIVTGAKILTVFNNTKEIFSMTPSGNVGILNTTPQYQLDVSGTGNFTSLLVSGTNITNTINSQLGKQWGNLTNSATTVWNVTPNDMEDRNILILTGNTTLAISGLYNGWAGTLQTIQSGLNLTGVGGVATGWSLTLPSGTKVMNAGSGQILLTQVSGAIDFINFMSTNGTNLFANIGNNFT